MRSDVLSGTTGSRTVPVGDGLNRVTEIAEHAIGIGASSITGDDCNARPMARPRGECRRFAVSQQIDHLVRLKVRQHRAVPPSSPSGPIIHPEHTRCGLWWPWPIA
jgi:hypothetical protein